MDKHTAKCAELIEELLRLASPGHNNVKDMMLWQRGYLTGLLATLMKNDSLTRKEISDRIEKHLEQVRSNSKK
jgi:hypothetical protein